MNIPKQSAPVRRDDRTSKGQQGGRVVQSGCCVEVAGVCIVSSPIC